jgi:hypothetical protein
VYAKLRSSGAHTPQPTPPIDDDDDDEDDDEKAKPGSGGGNIDPDDDEGYTDDEDEEDDDETMWSSGQVLPRRCQDTAVADAWSDLGKPAFVI